MASILLIEDRVERQTLFSQETGFDFQAYSDQIDNRTCLNMNNLDHYDTVICHRSAFAESSNNILVLLKEHCKKTDTKLVFFSGGISATYYSNRDNEFCILNSKDFYSENLKIFLEDIRISGESNLRILAYGKKWKINLMLNTLARVNQFIGENSNREKVKIQRFNAESKIENLKGVINIDYPKSSSNGALFMHDISEFAEELKEKINQEIMINA